MAKSKETILSQLGLTTESELDALLTALDKYAVVSDAEKNLLKASSVHTLPTVVKNSEQDLKQRMHGIVTDEDKGAIALMNRRNVLFEQVINVLNNKIDEIAEAGVVWIGEITTSPEETNHETLNYLDYGMYSFLYDKDYYILIYNRPINARANKKQIVLRVDEDSIDYVIRTYKYATKVWVCSTKTITYPEESSKLASEKYVEGLIEVVENKIPTKISQLTDDSDFIKNTVDNLINYYKKTETYTKDEINTLINNISTMTMEVVASLPTSNISTTTIYLVKDSSYNANNIYNEYLYINNNWELVGNTNMDLSNYIRKDEVLDVMKKDSYEVEELELEETEEITIATVAHENIDYEGDNQVPSTKAVNTMISNRVNELTNSIFNALYVKVNKEELYDNYYSKNETYHKNEVKELINAISTLTITVVSSLPTSNISPTTIYLVLKADGESPNIYEEYIYVNNTWELIGTTEIDLSNFYTKAESDEKYLPKSIGTVALKSDVENAIATAITNVLNTEV
jgi:hypothetical protein